MISPVIIRGKCSEIGHWCYDEDCHKRKKKEREKVSYIFWNWIDGESDGESFVALWG